MIEFRLKIRMNPGTIRSRRSLMEKGVLSSPMVYLISRLGTMPSGTPTGVSVPSI